MSAEPTMPGYEWVRCINADAKGMDRDGNAHFPCTVCTWQLKTPPPSPDTTPS